MTEAKSGTRTPLGAPEAERLVNLFPLLAYGLALLLRLIPVIMSRDLGIALDDMFQYDMLARSLASGNGFRWYAPPDLSMMLEALERYAGVDVSQIPIPDDPRGMRTSFRAPLYPLFLAAVYSLAGLQVRFFAVRLAQAFVMASLAPLSYFLALRLEAEERWARLAALIPALWPLLFFFPLALATENLFLPLLAAGTLSLSKAVETGRDRHFLLAALLLGLASLTRSVIVGFPLLVCFWLWWRSQRRGALIVFAVLVLVLGPWSVRNSLLHGKPTFVETSLGYNLYLGYHPEGDGSFLFGPSLDLVTILDDVERDAVGRELALSFIRRDPGRVPGLMIRKLGHLWGLEDRAFAFFYSNGLIGRLPTWTVVAAFVVMVLPLVLVLPLSVLGWSSGLFSSRTSGWIRTWWLLTLLFLWYIGIHMLVMAEERFHLALVPMLAALLARGLTDWASLRKGLLLGRPRAVRLAAIVALLSLLAFANWGFELAGNADRLALLFGPQGSTANFHY